MVVWAVGRKNSGKDCRARNSCAFFIGILRFWNAERPKWRSALKIQEKPAISMDCRFLCFHYTMNEIQMVRSRTVTCVITSRRRSSPTIYSNASSASLQTLAVLKCPFNFTWFAKKSAIGGFVRIRFPFSAVGAAAAFE